MRNYIVLWIILGLGVFLILQNVPASILGQTFTFLIALAIVWMLCSFVYGTLAIFYPDLTKESWGLQMLGEIAKFNAATSSVQSPNTPPTPTTERQKYLTQPEVLALVDAAFNTFGNKTSSPLTVLIAEEVQKQWKSEASTSSNPRFTQDDEKDVLTNPAYTSLVEKFLAQREMIFQLEKKMEEANTDNQQWQEKLVGQLQQKNAQLLILKNQEEAIQNLAAKVAVIENTPISTQVPINQATTAPDLSSIYEQIKKISTDQKTTTDALVEKIHSLEKRQGTLESNALKTETPASPNFATVYEDMAKLTEERKKAIDALYHKMVSLENRQKQIEMFPSDQGAAAPNLSSIYQKMEELWVEQQNATDTLLKKLTQLEERQLRLENIQPTLNAIVPDFDSIYEEIDKMSSSQQLEVKELHDRIKQLSQTQQLLLQQNEKQLSTAPRFEQMFKNFDEILAQQESVLEDLHEKIITKEDVLVLLESVAYPQNTLTTEEVSELIEAALAGQASTRKSQYVTRDQLKEGLIELAERVEEQLRSRR